MTLFSRSLVPLLLFGLVLVGCDSGGGSVPGNLGDSTTVGFDKTSATVVEGEDETYNLRMVANDPGFEEVQFTLSVDQQSTVALGDDITGLTGDTTVAFPQSAASGGTVSVPLGIVDEPVDSTGFLEDAETLSLTLSPADTLAPENIEQGQMNFTLTIEENDDPLTVEESRTRPSGDRTVVDALVTRVEPDSGAYLQDGTGGLFVADPGFVSGAGLAVSAGDSVRVDGTVGYADGAYRVRDATAGALTQEITSGNTLPAPQAVSLAEVMSNGETYEGELVKVDGFAIDNDGNSTFQGGKGYQISTSDTTSTLRIPSTSELVGNDIPEQANFQGVLGQDNGGGSGADQPDDGYQLMGLLSSDLEAVFSNFQLSAEASDLKPASGEGSTECMVRLPTGDLVFFNSADGGIFVWDGSSLSVHRPASDLNSDVPAESGRFDACDGAATNGDSIYFVLRSSNTNDNYIYKTEAADASNNAFKKFNGANALAASKSTVYIGGVAAFGAPENGIYEINSDLSGSVNAFATNSDVNPATITLDGQGTLFGFSSSFGSGDFESTLFTADVTASSPSISVYLNPYREDSPLNQAGDGITDLAPVTVNGQKFLVVYNASFDGPNGEEWAAVQRSDQTIDLLFTESNLTASLPVDGYTGGTAPLAASNAGDVYVASIPASGATNYIVKASDALP